jgi:hypothetical protein
MLIKKSAIVSFVTAVAFAGETAGAWACRPVEQAWLARRQQPATVFQTTRMPGASATRSSATSQGACMPNSWICFAGAGRWGLR